MFYRELMTQRPPKPPNYETAIRQHFPRTRDSYYVGGAGGGLLNERLPAYSCDIHLEGVFMLKMEIQDAVKRAEYRNWQQVYVVLHGTVLNIYQVKKDRGWWSNKSQNGPSVSPDCPPWITAGKLENSYSLLHGDAGIAADYRKYVSPHPDHMLRLMRLVVALQSHIYLAWDPARTNTSQAKTCHSSEGRNGSIPSVLCRTSHLHQVAGSPLRFHQCCCAHR